MSCIMLSKKKTKVRLDMSRQYLVKVIRPAKTTISPISPLNDEHEKIYCEPPPVWAAQLIKQVHDLQNQVEQLQEEVKTLRKISVKPCSSCGESEDKDADTLEALKLSTIPAKMGSAALAKTFSVDIKNEALVSGEHTAETENTTGVEQRILVPSVADGSVKDDPEKRKLMAEYDYINMQIMANQTAIDDALVYVKTLKQVDEASAAEHHSQIMELVVSVNQEKEKRASALAVLIVYCCLFKQKRWRLKKSSNSFWLAFCKMTTRSKNWLKSYWQNASVAQATTSGVLSKRVLSVEAFRRERLERSSVSHLTPSPTKAIPIPLYPGESQQQYSYKFEQWLMKKHIHLESVQRDPKHERKLWLAFAFNTLNPSTTERVAPHNATTKSNGDSDRKFDTYTTSSVSINEYMQQMKGPKQNRRTNGKLAKIPMPLFSGETMDDYEHELGRWLHHRQPSVLSLRFKPLKERLYRHQFANQRVLNRTASVSAKELHTQETRPQSLLPKAKSDVQEANEPTGSRDQAKHNATKATSSTELAAKTSLSQKIPEIKAAERAVQARVDEDSKMRHLTEAYNHLNIQISMNETAIDDGLDCIKAIKDVDEATAMEQHSQVMELVVLINKEKEKRASALAALIVY
ncbi:uncharacterized protein PITG_04896 [Phytophthora infestans T30-4]|uniref:Uncharacterized protein n=1 Tax=Phytophthora infestans (strain T30-4) TaxID=403677 RepID=D0N2B1_PHYIT|nr:uncharacterized protein PITG_04896 [Phytophthora infestans T30-4]EEY68440.1 hypothetical protein PITG_04896 [Phytophthora infestans T30-4]|eukprot:XP_002905599.1 hypothetical protein PITG_04896 [Phytophthora infestans T30-4]